MKPFRYLFLALPLLAGCSMLQNALKSQPSPTVHLAAVSLAGITLSQATLNFDIAVTNNYTVPLPVANVAYALASGGQPFLSGTANLQATIAVGETKTLRLPATLTYAQILATVKNLKPGAVLPYDATLNVFIDVPVAGRISVPLEKSGQVPIPNVPGIDVTAIHWQELSLSNATAVLDLKVANTCQYDLNVTQLGGGLTLAGTQVGQIGGGAGPALKAGQEGTIQIPITISAENLGLSAFRMLSGSGSDYHLSGNISISTPFGPMQLPYDKSGKVSFSH